MPILVGTASWTDKSLIGCGRFYPKEASSAEGRLRYYASQFPLVEVDSSYYAMPSATNAALWVERTPADFVFNIKAFRIFTGHQTSPTVLHKDLQQALGPPVKPMLYYKDVPPEIRTELWRRFIEAVAPLKHAGKLGAVHFQFAPWILRNAAGLELVRHCTEMMAGHTLAVEFRNKTWFDHEHTPATLAFERELGVAHVVVDAPQGFGNSVPPIWEATQPALAVVRLHGRNSATWNQKGLSASSDRFNYDYSDDELAVLVPQIQELSRMTARTHVIFNNNHEDQGQRNAQTLLKLLAQATPDTDA